jgi:hypothetical protein
MTLGNDKINHPAAERTKELGMKEVKYFFIMVCVLLFGCATVPSHSIREREQIGDKLVYEPIRRAEQKFTLIEENGVKGILFSYLQYFDEYRVIEFQSYTIKTDTLYFFEIPIKEKGQERTNEQITTQKDRTGNRKSEQLVPPKGTEIVISLGEKSPPKISIVVGDNGKIFFDNELKTNILNSVENIEELKKSSVSIPSLDISAKIDFAEIEFVKSKIFETQELIKTVPQNNIATAIDFEKYITGIIALKSKIEYKLQSLLLIEKIKSSGNELYNLLNSEKETIESAIPQFFIRGEILNTYTNNNARVYEIWGTSFPIPQNDTTLRSDGFRNARSNMNVVIHNNIETENINQFGVNIVIERGVYYIARDSGRNSMGQSVPIFVFSNNMEQVPGVGNRKQRLDTINIQLRSAREISSQYMAELQ